MNNTEHILFFVTEDWYFCSHRIDLAKDAIKNGFKVSVATRVDKHRKEIEDAGINLISLNIERSKVSLLSDLNLIQTLISIYRKEKPSVVHHVAVKPVIYGSIAAIFCRHKNVINALGGLGFVFSSSSIKAKLLKPFIQQAFRFLLNRNNSRLIVQNNDDYTLFSETFSVDKKQISLIKGAGVDNKYYQVLPLPNGPIKVTLISRMLVDKGIFEFVEAAKILKQKGYEGVFTLVGDPDPLNPGSIDEKQLREWHDSGVVTWKGFQSDIRSVWENAHISVLPSYREGLPKSLLESAACGRPIITTDVPGCREVVKDGVNGILVPVKNSLALANAIEKLSEYSELRHVMALAGRKMIDEEFCSDKIHEKTINLYKDIICR